MKLKFLEIDSNKHLTLLVLPLELAKVFEIYDWEPKLILSIAY